MENETNTNTNQKSDTPEHQENNRNSDGTFKQGISGNPAGRPKGQSLKEFWRARFANMTEEEKLEFTDKVGLDVVWKMAEGNPANNLELTGEIQSKIVRTDE